MKKCEKCGAELADGAVFCHECGARVIESGSPAASDDKTVETTMPPLAKTFSDARYSGGRTGEEAKIIFEKLASKWDEIFARDEFLGGNVEFGIKELQDVLVKKLSSGQPTINDAFSWFGQGLKAVDSFASIFETSVKTLASGGSLENEMERVKEAGAIKSYSCLNPDKKTELAYIAFGESISLEYSAENGKKLELSADAGKICVSLSAPGKDTISATAEGNLEAALVTIKAFVGKLEAEQERCEQAEAEAQQILAQEKHDARIAATKTALDDALGDL